MHLLANHHVNSVASVHNAQMATRILLVMSNNLDCEGYRKDLHTRLQLERASRDFRYRFGLARAERFCPQLLILDPKVGLNAISNAVTELPRLQIAHLVVLDDHVRDGLLINILQYQEVSYLTRQCGIETLKASISQIVSTDKRVFDPAVPRST